MSDEYLWDRSGEPDTEVQHLEELLGQFKLSRSTVAFQKQKRPRWWMAAVAAIFIVGAITATVVIKRTPPTHITAWQLSLAGGKTTPVRSGQTIETSARNQATLESAFVGTVRIAPQSRVRVLAGRGEQQRLALDRGTIHALIWAPPTVFTVDTPWAKAIDLGCQYTLHVDRAGSGLLTVETGWVAFQWKNLESFIPAGAACATRAEAGPGTPYFLDAPAGLTEGIAKFDDINDSKALETILAAARPRDSLTLWHLLRRTEGRERAEVFDRLSRLVDLPPAASRTAILRGDQNAIDAAWNALDLGDTRWWREWKREW